MQYIVMDLNKFLGIEYFKFHIHLTYLVYFQGCQYSDILVVNPKSISTRKLFCFLMMKLTAGDHTLEYFYRPTENSF